MATQVLVKDATAVVFKGSGGDVVLTLGGLDAAKGRISAQWDRGASARPFVFTVGAKVKFKTTAATKGKRVAVYLVPEDGGIQASGLGTSDAELTDADRLLNLSRWHVMDVVVDRTDVSATFTGQAVMELYHRKVSVLVWNHGDQELSDASVDDCVVTLTPYAHEA